MKNAQRIFIVVMLEGPFHQIGINFHVNLKNKNVMAEFFPSNLDEKHK